MAEATPAASKARARKELAIWILILVTMIVGVFVKMRYEPITSGYIATLVATPPTSTYRAAAQELVRQQLRDPSSAEFSDINVKLATPGHVTVVCGYVNARNGFGGMTGRQRFVAGNIVTIESAVGAETMNQLWNGVC